MSDSLRTPVRLAAIVALVLGVIAVGWILLGGNGSSSYTLIFQNAGQLVVGNEVQIGGVPRGTVDSIELTNDNQARVVISVEEPFAPLPRGTTAEIRAPSLSSVAGRFVQLHLGPNTRGTLEDGATIDGQKTQGIVDLDQLFDTFDAKTRRGLQQFVQGQGNQFKDVAAGLQQSAHYFSPSLSTGGQLFGKLAQDQVAFQRFLRSTASTMNVLAQSSPEIEELVSNASGAFSATAAQQNGLRDGIAELPETFVQGDRALTAFGKALPALTGLVDATTPAAPGLAPFLATLQRLFTGLEAPLTDVGEALSPTQPSIVTATAALPALQEAFGPMTTHSVQALDKLTPILSFLRPFGPELTSFFKSYGQASAVYDANGHYLRATPNFNDYKVTAAGTLTPNPPSTPLAGAQTGQTRRCPGAATQPSLDGSAPWDVGACDPKQVAAG